VVNVSNVASATAPEILMVTRMQRQLL